jgi:hypothetical protein
MASGSDAGLPLLALNQDNLRAALGWGQEADPLGTLRMAAGLEHFWPANNLVEGRRWLEEALARVPEPSPHRARALLATGTLAMIQQMHEDSNRLLVESLTISIELEDRVAEAWARTTLGQLAWMEDDPGAARSRLEQSSALHEALGDRFGLARSLIHQGTAMCLPNAVSEGRTRLERGLLMAGELDDTWGEAYALMMLGFAEIDAGEFASAAPRLRMALRTRAVGPIMAGPLEGLAHIVAEGDPDRAMRLLGAAMGIRQRLASRPPPIIIRRIERVRARPSSSWSRAPPGEHGRKGIRWPPKTRSPTR